jgi:protein-L-isoaspartate(D-aspartate) O-methyltransferase
MQQQLMKIFHNQCESTLFLYFFSSLLYVFSCDIFYCFSIPLISLLGLLLCRGHDQTISQPYVVAYMIQAADLKLEDRVLDIGTGTGYAAAVYAELSKEVYTIEKIEVLFTQAKERLSEFGYENIHCFQGDGSLGLKEYAPFDVILVGASVPSIPSSLKEQLTIGGRLIIPVQVNEFSDQLYRVTRIAENEYQQESLISVLFLPLIGEEGFKENTKPQKENIRLF